MHSQRGFTLLELLVVVGLLMILLTITITGVNPARQISNTRNAQRQGAVNSIQAAINQYALDSFGGYPAGIDATLRMIGTATSSCAVSCGPDVSSSSPAGITSFTDNSQPTFDAGTHSNTQWATSSPGGVGLNATGLIAKTGTYLSSIKDGGQSVSWNSLSWLPNLPYGKELPTLQQVETGYPTGSASMSGNVMLLRLNSMSSPLADSSGNNNTATIPSGGVSLLSSAKFNGGATFAGGANNYLQVNSVANLNLPNAGGSVMLWIKPTITDATIPQNTGMGILRKPDYNGNLYGPGGYGFEVYRNLTTQPANIKMTLGSLGGVQSLIGTTNIQNGIWYHVAVSWNASTMNIYVNGALDATVTRSGGTITWTYGTEKLYIGHNAAANSTGYDWYNGSMDEIALFNRQLTLAEINAAYQRGALHPKLTIRSCSASNCSGATFVGPDGTANTYFSEETNTSLIPTASFTPNTTANRYFQYQLKLDSDTSVLGPVIGQIAGGNNGTPSGGGGSSTTETTADSCLNIGSLLAPTHIPLLPFDPVVGSSTRTYYAVKKTGTDNLTVRACSPELSKSIQVVQ